MSGDLEVWNYLAILLIIPMMLIVNRLINRRKYETVQAVSELALAKANSAAKIVDEAFILLREARTEILTLTARVAELENHSSN